MENPRKSKIQEDVLLNQYHRDKQLLYAAALGILHEPQLAEDALQEAFINLAKYRPRFLQVPEEKRRSYLLAVVKNQCFLLAEREKRITPFPADETESWALAGWIDVESLVLSEETKAMVAKALESLEDSQRQILILRYYHDCGGQEIANLLGISHSAARMRLHRAVKKLGNIIKQEVETSE